MRIESTAAWRSSPLSAFSGGLRSKSDCFGPAAEYGEKSGVLVKLALMSFAMRSNSDIVGRPRISSIVFRMLGCE